MTLEERFWSKVKIGGPDECWPRVASVGHGGYGKIRVGKRTRIASRVVWEMKHGSIPEGLFVLHHCDNPPCCNGTHLFLGTSLANGMDRDQKGRGNHHLKICRGELNGSSKLTGTQVIEIRATYLPRYGNLKAMAEKYSVAVLAIKNVVLWKTWKHLKEGGNVSAF